MFSASRRVLQLCHVYKGVDIWLISSDILVLYKPFNLLFYHFLLRQEHVFQYFYQFSLKLGISNFLPHFHYLDDSLLVGDKKKKTIFLNAWVKWQNEHSTNRRLLERQDSREIYFSLEIRNMLHFLAYVDIELLLQRSWWRKRMKHWQDSRDIRQFQSKEELNPIPRVWITR